MLLLVSSFRLVGKRFHSFAPFAEKTDWPKDVLCMGTRQSQLWINSVSTMLRLAAVNDSLANDCAVPRPIRNLGRSCPHPLRREELSQNIQVHEQTQNQTKNVNKLRKLKCGSYNTSSQAVCGLYHCLRGEPVLHRILRPTVKCDPPGGAVAHFLQHARVWSVDRRAWSQNVLNTFIWFD